MNRPLGLWHPFGLSALVVASVLSAGVAGADIDIQGVRPVDVTPQAFTLIWRASAASLPQVEIYADAAGAQEITDQLEVKALPLQTGDPEEIEPYFKRQSMAALRGRQSLLGVMRVRISGAQPDTLYHYRVRATALSDNPADAGVWPADSLASVRTRPKTSFVEKSVQVLVTVPQPDATGWLVTAHAEGATFGASAIFGDGTADNQAYLNLANLVDASGEPWAPDGPVDLTLEIDQGFEPLI